MFRAYSAERRDRAPLIETEDFRDEGARRFWDDYSPPYYKAKKGPNDTWKRDGFLYTTESFALAGRRALLGVLGEPHLQHRPRALPLVRLLLHLLHRRGRRRPPGLKRSLPRQRQSRRHAPAQGDLLRLPRHAERDARPAHPRPLDLPRNPARRHPNRQDHLRHRQHRVRRAVRQRQIRRRQHQARQRLGLRLPRHRLRPRQHQGHRQERRQGRRAAGDSPPPAPPPPIKLTPILGPGGLQADGQDIALIDFEVVDAKGQRCPTDDARVDFTCTGPAIWRGGYNSGKSPTPPTTSTSTPSCGINRVAVRSTLTPGAITVTAKRDGLKSAQIQIVSKKIVVTDGIATVMPAHMKGPAEA